MPSVIRKTTISPAAELVAPGVLSGVEVPGVHPGLLEEPLPGAVTEAGVAAETVILKASIAEEVDQAYLAQNVKKKL